MIGSILRGMAAGAVVGTAGLLGLAVLRPLTPAPVVTVLPVPPEVAPPLVPPPLGSTPPLPSFPRAELPPFLLPPPAAPVAPVTDRPASPPAAPATAPDLVQPQPLPEPEAEAPPVPKLLAPRTRVAELPQIAPPGVSAPPEPLPEATAPEGALPLGPEPVVPGLGAPLPDDAPLAEPPAAAPERPKVLRLGETAAPSFPGAPTPGLDMLSALKETAPPADAPAPDPAAPPPRWRALSAAPESAAPESVGLLLRVGQADLLALASVTPGQATLLLDPSSATAEQATGLRAKGYELAALLDPPAGARPQDLDPWFEALDRVLPEAALVVLVAGSGAAPDAAHIAARVAERGLALVTPGAALDALGRAADSAGVAHVPLYRDLDDQTGSALMLRRALDRAGFETRRRGQVVVMLSASDTAALGLQTWLAGGPKVALVPVTALLPR